MQQWHGLQWEFTPLSTTCNFMDLTVTITPSGHLSTTLSEKPQNLYLYIPPSSAHPKGGLITGSVLRYYTASVPTQLMRADKRTNYTQASFNEATNLSTSSHSSTMHTPMHRPISPKPT